MSTTNDQRTPPEAVGSVSFAEFREAFLWKAEMLLYKQIEEAVGRKPKSVGSKPNTDKTGFDLYFDDMLVAKVSNEGKTFTLVDWTLPDCQESNNQDESLKKAAPNAKERKYIIFHDDPAVAQIKAEADAAFFKAFPEGISPGACHTQHNLIAIQSKRSET